MDMKKLIIFTIIITLRILLSSPATGFYEANSYYEKGQFENAAIAYRDIIESGYENADVYYNLGNCYYQTGDIVKALVNYERALRLRADDGDILNNLQLIRTGLEDKSGDEGTIPFFQAYTRFKVRFSAHSISGWFYLSLYIFGFILCMSILPFNSIVGKIFKISIYPTLAISLLLSLIYYDIYSSGTKRFGIISEQRTAALSSPDDNVATTELFFVHLGTKAQIIRSSGDRYEIYLDEDRQGWINKSSIIEI